MGNNIDRVDANYIKTSRPLDSELFFSEEETIEIKEHQTTLAHLLADAKILSSVSEGKRNGWGKPIPLGFSQFIVGRKKGRISILNENLEVE